jgi:LCP family protein required for cell wall assembly
VGIKAFLEPPVGRTSFIVMGIAGSDHAGKDLTDSMMLVTIDNQTGRTLILSLPRDIWITEWRAKLNGIYHYQGMDETKKIVQEITGRPVDYGLVLDFNFFKGVVDQLGGIEVNVERSFDDFKYPINGKENDLCNGDKEFKCRYEHLRFETGIQRMDGELALKFVRSRNAEGDEGTDFARDQRQQKVILAIKNKALSLKFLLTPGRPYGLLKTVLANIKTDIPQNKYFELAKIGLRLRTKNITTAVLGEDYLVNPKPSKIYDNQWVLIPKAGGWEEVKKYIFSLISPL